MEIDKFTKFLYFPLLTLVSLFLSNHRFETPGGFMMQRQSRGRGRSHTGGTTDNEKLQARRC